MKFLQIGYTSILFSSVVAQVSDPIGSQPQDESQQIYGNLTSTYSVADSLVRCDFPDLTKSRTFTSGDIYAIFNLSDITIPSYMSFDICRTTLNNQVVFAGTLGSTNPAINVLTKESDQWRIRINLNPSSSIKCTGPIFMASRKKIISFLYDRRNRISNPYKYNLGYMVDLCVKSSMNPELTNLFNLAVNKTITVPANFCLIFDIKPLGNIYDLTSVIHFSKDKTNLGPQGRVPAIWFRTGTTKLMVRVATTANPNDGIVSSIKSLPINSVTQVRLEAYGPNVFLIFNGTVDSMVSLSANRIFGDATLYIPNPWNLPAPASIGYLQLSAHLALSPAASRYLLAQK